MNFSMKNLKFKHIFPYNKHLKKVYAIHHPLSIHEYFMLKIPFSNAKSSLKVAFNLAIRKEQTLMFTAYFPTLRGFVGFAACQSQKNI